LGWASDEWLTLGWVEPHNSYLHILYRSGLIGIFFVSIIFGFFIWLLSQAFQLRSLTAILFSAIVWNWIVAANFLIIFEMPYTAIPFWTLFGLALAYCDQIKGTSVKQEG
jgi:O-antigen ligase